MSLCVCLECLTCGSGIRSQKGVATLLSFSVQLGKQSTGVACYLAVRLLYLYFIAELKWTSKVSEESTFTLTQLFLSQLRTCASAKLPTSGLLLQGQSAYSVSQQPS